jgi:WD40 repeat protein
MQLSMVVQPTDRPMCAAVDHCSHEAGSGATGILSSRCRAWPMIACVLGLTLVGVHAPSIAQRSASSAVLLQAPVHAPTVIRLEEPYRGFTPRSIALSPDGRWLVSTSAAEEVLWQSEDSPHHLDDRHRFNTNIAIAAGGRSLVFARLRDLYELPMPTESAPTSELRLFGVAYWSVARVAASTDGRFVATGGYDGMVELWTRSGEPSTRLQVPKAVTALGFSGDAGLLAIGDRSGTVTLVRLDLQGPRAGPACPPEVFAMRADCARSRLSLGSEVRALSLNGNGSILVTSDWLGGAQVWNLRAYQHRPLALTTMPLEGASDVALSVDGTKLALATATCARDSACVEVILLWDLQQDTVRLLHRSAQTVKLPAAAKVAVSADGRTVAARLTTGEILQWRRL